MDREHPTGVARRELAWALRQERMVLGAVQRDSCLLCRGGRVNEAGLCGVCVVLLDDEERRLVERWQAGVGP